METLEAVQIADGRLVFSPAALALADAQGIIEPEYAAQINRQARVEAVTDALTTVRSTITNTLGNMASAAAMELKLAMFDKFHGTNYREVRHALVEKERRTRFLASVGMQEVRKR